jgi:hypothetical protein
MTDTFTDQEWSPPDADSLPPENGETPYIPEDIPGRGQDDDAITFDFLDDNLADFLKKPTTAKAREYQKKVNAFLNTGMRFCIQQPGLLPDAAAIIAHGGKFAKACGDLADADETAAKFLDIITSPQNPYVMFAVTAIPLVAQLIRNHEPQLAEVPGKFRNRKKSTRAERKAARMAKPGLEIRIPVLRRKMTLRLPVGLRLGYGRSQTVDPERLAAGVFANEKVRRELDKRGIQIGVTRG